jgi:hypothetical protein
VKTSEANATFAAIRATESLSSARRPDTKSGTVSRPPRSCGDHPSDLRGGARPLRFARTPIVETFDAHDQLDQVTRLRDGRTRGARRQRRANVVGTPQARSAHPASVPPALDEPWVERFSSRHAAAAAIFSRAASARRPASQCRPPGTCVAPLWRTRRNDAISAAESIGRRARDGRGWAAARSPAG